MTQSDFKQALEKLLHIPADKRERALNIAEDLDDKERSELAKKLTDIHSVIEHELAFVDKYIEEMSNLVTEFTRKLKNQDRKDEEAVSTSADESTADSLFNS